MIIMNKIKIFIIVLFLSSCGYTSIYKDISDIKLNIKINNIKGDKDINNSLKRKLKSILAIQIKKLSSLI